MTTVRAQTALINLHHVLAFILRWCLFLLFFGTRFVMSSHVLFHEFELGLSGFSVHLSVDLGVSEELIVVLHELSASFLIQTGLWEGNNQQALDHLEDVGERPASWIPVFLQSVDADLTRWYCHIGMEDLSDEIAYFNITVNNHTLWRFLWEFPIDD